MPGISRPSAIRTKAVGALAAVMLGSAIALGPAAGVAAREAPASPGGGNAEAVEARFAAVYACPETPLWVNDTAYGSAGLGFYWDPVSSLVWTAERQWHRFDPQPPRTWLPLWVDAYGYGSGGMGFYWDPVSGLVWTSERHWHAYDPQGCIPDNARDYAIATFEAWATGNTELLDALAEDDAAAVLKAVTPEDPGAWTLAGCDAATGQLGCTFVSPAGPRLQLLVVLELASQSATDAVSEARFN